MKKVLYIGSDLGFESARSLAGDNANIFTCSLDSEAVYVNLQKADALLDASMKVPITETMIAGAPNLRIISTATTGSDHIARSALASRGIALHTLREVPALLQGLTPAAEHSFALLMALARRLVPAVEHVRDGKWQRELFPGIMLNGKTLGLIGCGRIGQWMARYAAAFGMRVQGYDPAITKWPDGITKANFDEVIETSDFVSVHVHLSDGTRRLLDARALSRMKPGAILINTSRGALIDEVALLEALESGRIGGAGLDVLDGEPDVRTHPLRRYATSHSNLLITPHCGGFSPDAVERVCHHAMGVILDHFEVHP